MDPPLEPYVKKLLDGGMKTAEDVAKFIEVQTPELGKEIITWGAASEAMAPLFSLVLATVVIFIHINYKKAVWYCDGARGDPPVCIFNAMAFVFSVGFFFIQVMDVFYPILAPRLYILEKIGSFIK